MIAYRFGYDISTDLHHGFIVVWGKRRKKILSFHWNWPYFLWFNRSWAVDEKGHISAMPVWRGKPKRWLLRAWVWPVCLQINQWQTQKWLYIGVKPERPKQYWEHHNWGKEFKASRGCPPIDNTIPEVVAAYNAEVQKSRKRWEELVKEWGLDSQEDVSAIDYYD